MQLVKDWWGDVEGETVSRKKQQDTVVQMDGLTFDSATYPSQKGHQEVRRYTFQISHVSDIVEPFLWMYAFVDLLHKASLIDILAV